MHPSTSHNTHKQVTLINIYIRYYYILMWKIYAYILRGNIILIIIIIIPFSTPLPFTNHIFFYRGQLKGNGSTYSTNWGFPSRRGYLPICIFLLTSATFIPQHTLFSPSQPQASLQKVVWEPYSAYTVICYSYSGAPARTRFFPIIMASLTCNMFCTILFWGDNNFPASLVCSDTHTCWSSKA